MATETLSLFAPPEKGDLPCPEVPPGTPSSVHPHESTDGSKDASLPSDDYRSAQYAAESFRHSGWSRMRAAVRNALDASGASSRRLDAFDACGSSCWLMQSTDDPDVFKFVRDT